MKFTSPILSEARGSLAGLTFSANKGGNYIRARSIPTNPNTPAQQAVRAALSQLSVLWNDLLTKEQRDGWGTYAENVPLLDSLGQPRVVTALNMYIRSNVPRLQAALVRVDDAPIAFNLGEFSAPVFAIDTAASEVDVAFSDTDAWTGEDDSSMLVYGSVPKSPTINFFKGPYRLLGTIDGDGTTPPTSPAALALSQPISVGQRGFFRVVVSRADGRLSSDFLGFSDAP